MSSITQPVVTTQNANKVGVLFTFNVVSPAVISGYDVRLYVNQTGLPTDGISYPTALQNNVNPYQFSIVPGNPLITVPNVLNYIFAVAQAPGPPNPDYPVVFSTPLLFTYDGFVPPSTPTIVSTSQNTLTVTFNSNGTSAADYLFGITVSPTPSAAGPNVTVFTASQTATNVYVSELMTLPVDVPNYIFATAFPRVVGQPSLFSATPLQFQFDGRVSAPEEPFLVFRDGTGIQVQFDTEGQTGVPPITYSIETSVVPDFSVSTTVAAGQVSGTIFGTAIFSINPSVLNYIRAIATNASGAARSSVFIFDPAETGPPSGPTSTPVVLGTPAQTAITVSYNTVGITGNPPFATQCFASTSNSGPFNIGCAEQLIGPNQYTATASGLLPNTNYYFQTIITNGVLPNQVSAVSAAILTAGGSAGAPTIPPSIPVLNSGPTQNIIQVFINAASANGTPPVSINVVYDSNPSGAFSNLATLAPATAPNSYIATASGLNPGVTYYFKSEAVNMFGGIRSQKSAGFTTLPAGTNPFNNGYSPPRPWAPGNANYVAGVLSPFRQQ